MIEKNQKKYTPKYRSDIEKNNYIKRLNRITGQVKGINKMIIEDRQCDEILIQITAVKKAIDSLGREILENHMKTCMIEDINNKKYESIDEIIDLFRRFK